LRQPLLISGFDPELSINSGQVFLWERVGRAWYGIHADKVIRFTNWNGKLYCESFTSQKDEDDQAEDDNNAFVQKMFRLDDDTDSIFEEISRDPMIQRLIISYPGLRLIRQDPAQCAISFVCASNTNIPMIKRMLGSLAKKYGQKVIIDGREFHTFPSMRVLDRAPEIELRNCGLGYRAKAVKAVARAIVDGTVDLDSLKRASYSEAKNELLRLYGIGPKIADCIMLFSLEKLDAFPIDVWIARALANYYNWMSGRKISERLTERQYSEISGAARSYFGKYAGYAQQFLYYHMRQDAGRRWQ
jgi:N-glycosylase/DNA lyase